MEFTIRQHVAAPPAEVFAAATDFANAPEHIAGIQRVEMLTAGPVGKGTRFRETRVLFNREATEEMEVVEFDPPRAYALGAENHGCRYLTTLTFEPAGEGTDVEMRFRAAPLTFVARVMAFLMRPLAKKVVQECGKDLEGLASSIEKRRDESADDHPPTSPD
jgi:carbon monoxide dehydrogenase subunit G